MRRALPAALMSAAGLGLVLTFKTAPAVSGTRVATKAPSAQPSAAAPPPSGAATSSPAATVAPPTGAPRPTAPRPSVVVRSTTPPTTSTTVVAPAPGAAGTGNFKGEVVDTRFGPVQVQVTLQAGKIVDVAELQVPNDRRRSIAINNAAGPILREEVLQAQSANIDTVSGATVTSDAYAQSLQAALDQAHAGG